MVRILPNVGHIVHRPIGISCNTVISGTFFRNRVKSMEVSLERTQKRPEPRRALAWGIRGAVVGETPRRLSLCEPSPPPPRTGSPARRGNGKIGAFILF